MKDLEVARYNATELYQRLQTVTNECQKAQSELQTELTTTKEELEKTAVNLKVLETSNERPPCAKQDEKTVFPDGQVYDGACIDNLQLCSKRSADCKNTKQGFKVLSIEGFRLCFHLTTLCKCMGFFLH